jgi:superfamily II DNA or RNA helicase
MELILKNPNYLKMIKLGKSVRWTPKEITIPILESHYLEAAGQTSIKLYPEQQVIFDHAKDQTTGLVEARTAAGKTVMSIALHEAWGGRTVVVCHSLILAKQFAEEFKKFIGVKPTFFCNGKHDHSGEVVVTTMTTFRQKSQLFTGFDNLIIDEADLAMTDKMMKAIANFEAKRKHAFTGTVQTMYDEFNPRYAPVLGTFWGAHVIHRSDENIPLKAVYSHTYTKTYYGVFPHVDWQEFRAELDKDIDRKKAQLKYIFDNTDAEGYSLCLWDRVADVESFYKAFKNRGYTVYMSTGEMKKADREQHLADFKRTGGYLLGVSSTLNRGYDNTLLTKAFIMHPIKGENPLRQSIGRIMRHFEGKESFLYLWSDSMLKFQLKKQEEIIQKHFNLPVCKNQTSGQSFRNGGSSINSTPLRYSNIKLQKPGHTT